MMEIIINTENLNKKEVEILNKLKKKSMQNLIWKPQNREEFYLVSDAGYTASITWANRTIDMGSWSIGNVFKTKEEAEFAAEKLRVTAELKRYAAKYNDKINWKADNSIKYYFVYHYRREEITIFSESGVCHNDIYFSSEEVAENAIKAIGKERIKKYYLEVE